VGSPGLKPTQNRHLVGWVPSPGVPIWSMMRSSRHFAALCAHDPGWGRLVPLSRVALELLTSGAVTHARAKLKEGAFTKLNQACVLPTVYGPDYPIQRWRGPRLLANLESVLSEPTQAALREQSTPETQARQVNRSNSYPALKHPVLDLLYRDVPVPTVINKLMRLFQGSPVSVRPKRKVPRRRRPSFHRSYHFQRRVKKVVF